MDDAYTEQRMLLLNNGNRSGNFLPEYKGRPNIKQTFLSPYAGYGIRYNVAPENQYNQPYNFRQPATYLNYEVHKHAPIRVENDMLEERTVRKLEHNPLTNNR